MNNSIIILEDVAVNYKEGSGLFSNSYFPALKKITFNVVKGETLGVIGKNGAGKSTLLRVLAGIIKPDSGNITHDVQSVSLMALAAGFDLNLSGYQNTIISGMLIGYRKKEILENIDSIFDFSELQDFYYKPVKTYSSGMRARLAFSIAMYISPEVLLIDEVLGVGDSSFQQKASLALEEKISSDLTVIIVSHSEEQVSRLSDRLIWIDNGVVRKEGLAAPVFNEYNQNIQFSTYNARVDNYNIKDGFEISFENIHFEQGFVHFNMVLINKDKKPITAVFCQGNGYDSTMMGPNETPGWGNRYQNNPQAKRARFLKGMFKLDETAELVAVIDDVKVTVLTLVISMNR